MATRYRCCTSTRRIATIDAFPKGAEYPYHIDVHAVSFEDDGVKYSLVPRSIAKCYASDEDELARLLQCFGLLWEECEHFADGLEMLSEDYERRSDQLCGFRL